MLPTLSINHSNIGLAYYNWCYAPCSSRRTEENNSPIKLGNKNTAQRYEIMKTIKYEIFSTVEFCVWAICICCDKKTMSQPVYLLVSSRSLQNQRFYPIFCVFFSVENLKLNISIFGWFTILSICRGGGGMWKWEVIKCILLGWKLIKTFINTFFTLNGATFCTTVTFIDIKQKIYLCPEKLKMFISAQEQG